MRLLFNYLPYSMKEADSVVRSPKKAGTKATTDGSCNNTKITRFFNKLYNSTCNNTAPTNTDNLNKNGSLKKRASKSTAGPDKPAERRGRKKKIVAENNTTEESSSTIINGTKRKKSTSSSQVSTASSSSLASSSSMSIGKSSTSNPTKKATKKDRKGKKGNNKISPKLRPRRRASQTYFFKYQLARNPLKAEEEDLKLALLASLQQDDAELATQHKQQLKRQQLIYEHHLQNNNNNNNNKQPKKAVKGNKNQQSSKQQKHKQPPTNETTVQQDKPTPPSYDEDYLEKYRPDTEEFLTFICSRLPKETNISAPSSPRRELSTTIPTASGSIDLPPHSINYKPSNGCTPTNTGIHVKISNDKTSNELHNLRRSASPCKSLASNSSPNPLNSPSNRRRPIRHSPRLASTSKKISEFDSLNCNTAYDSQITYEEEMNRASMALKDIAQEINGTDESESSHQASQKNINGNTTAVTAQSETKSPFKNNKHLVRGLMTREFAGAFADEDIIFESIKNHKL